MLRIRPKQVKAFEQAAAKSFQDRMVEHIREFFPKHLAILGEPAIREVVGLGIDRGSIHGFITEHDLCLYIDLMLLLGCLFDEDPQYPWAEAILNDKGITDNAARTERLYDEAMAFLDAAAGEEGEHLTRALVALRKTPLKEAWQPGPGKLDDRLLAQLRALWPQKCERVGAGPLGLMIARGVEAARGCHLSTEFGALVYVVLMFLLGSGFGADPQHRWAQAVLNDASPAARAGKAGRLCEAAMAHLEAWLA
ncbi:MAG TPA: hypothetical protein VNE39_04275 [Planctomycetota bacterium]|nr:hypothetical protein [Planctomycetota bacterium]